MPAAPAPVVAADQLAIAIANAVPKKGKKIDKVKCYRCGVAGHLSVDCTAELCDTCEEPAHTEGACPLIDAPKPQLIMYGYAHEELILYEFPCTESYRPKMENVRLASDKTHRGGDDGSISWKAGKVAAYH